VVSFRTSGSCGGPRAGIAKVQHCGAGRCRSRGEAKHAHMSPASAAGTYGGCGLQRDEECGIRAALPTFADPH
jgi:hypothetical protein